MKNLKKEITARLETANETDAANHPFVKSFMKEIVKDGFSKRITSPRVSSGEIILGYFASNVEEIKHSIDISLAVRANKKLTEISIWYPSNRQLNRYYDSKEGEQDIKADVEDVRNAAKKAAQQTRYKYIEKFRKIPQKNSVSVVEGWGDGPVITVSFS